MMENLKIPEDYQRVMPYLIIDNASDFLSFTKNVFGAEEKYKAMRTESLIMHAEIRIGNSVIMLADTTAEHAKQTAGLFLYVDNCDSVYQNAIHNGAMMITEPTDQDYGRSAGIRDPFGNVWWLTQA